MDFNTCNGDHTWGKCDRDDCDFNPLLVVTGYDIYLANLIKPDPRSIDAMEAACQRSNCGHRWIDHDPHTSWFGCLIDGCQCVSYRTNSEYERMLYPGGENDPAYAMAPRRKPHA